MSFGGGGGARTSRGGRDQFQWGDVAADKDRENYLGHSLLAPVGRWQINKDLQWYTKEKADVGRAGMKGAGGSAGAAAAAAAAAAAQSEQIARERALIKQEEEDRRLEALGIRKRVPKPVGLPQLDPAEAAQLFSKSSSLKSEPSDPAAASAGADSSADRVSGLGFNPQLVPTGAHGGAVPGGLQLEAGGEMEGVGMGMHDPSAAAASSASAAAAASSSAAAPAASPARSLADDHAELLLLSDPSLDPATRALLVEAAAIRAKEARRRERKLKESKSNKKESRHKDKDRDRKEAKKESKRERRHRSRSRSQSASRAGSRSCSRSRSRDRDRDRDRDRSRERRKHRDRRDDEAARVPPSPAVVPAVAAAVPSVEAAPSSTRAASPRSRSRSRSPRHRRDDSRDRDRHRHRSSRHDSRSRSRSRDRKRER